MGEMTDKLKGSANKALGKAKQHSDNPDTRAKGAGQELKGKVQKASGAIKGKLGDRI